MRKVYLDNIITEGKYLLWSKSVGKQCHFNYDDIEGDFLIQAYDDEKIQLKYEDRIEWLKTDSVKNGKIQKLIFQPKGEFRYNIGQILRNNLTITDRYKERVDHENGKYNIYKHYVCRCNICGKENIDFSEYYINRNGISCPICGTRNFTIKGINDIPTTDPWMIAYFQGGEKEAAQYCHSSNQKIIPRCPECGRIREKPVSINAIYYTHSIGCACSDGISFPNKFMHNLLEQLGIVFESEYSPDWIHPLRYDFYIPSIKLIIEMDGGQHYEDARYKKLMSLKEMQKNDELKNQRAKEHSLKIARINCNYKSNERFLFVKERVTKELSVYFDLSTIDWEKLAKQSYNSMVLTVSKIKNDNPNMTGMDIALSVNYHYSTVYKWLKIAEKLGLCSNSKIDQRVVDLNTGVIYDNNISFIQAIEKTGINIEKSAISNMVQRHQNSYKGFRIRKIRTLTDDEREELSKLGVCNNLM